VDPSAEHGPEVAPGEGLYRFVTVSSFWVAAENRPSSSLFDDPPYVSVNVASLTTIEKCLAQLRDDLGSPSGGMVSFSCGQARQLGFNARHEPEKDNPAHAHLYCDKDRPKQRKKNAQRLARLCRVVIQPRFS
jgi:hypothetical protein